MVLSIIQWGTGAVGKEVLAGILDARSGLELAGVKVYSADKDGVDAGASIGRDAVGVVATASREQALALDADCVVYTPRLTDVDEVCAILASGKNVVTTAFLFHPNRIAAELGERCDGDAGTQRRARSVCGRTGFRDDGHTATGAQPHRLRQRLIVAGRDGAVSRHTCRFKALRASAVSRL